MVSRSTVFSIHLLTIKHFRTKTFTYFLHVLLPYLAELFPSTVAQKAAFGPGAYLMGGDALPEREGLEFERREAEVWGFAAALAVNAAEDEQTTLVGALREKILHTVQSARAPGTSAVRAEMKLRNVNMFLNGLVSVSRRRGDLCGYLADATMLCRVWTRR